MKKYYGEGGCCDNECGAAAEGDLWPTVIIEEVIDKVQVD